MLNQGTLDGLIVAATNSKEVDTAKLGEALGHISNKLFGVGEPGAGQVTLAESSPIMTNTRGIDFSVLKIDANGVIHLGSPRNSGAGFISTYAGKPTGGVAAYPAGSVAMNGCLVVSVTGSIIFYSNGLRYFINGTVW